jgi:hypothetical protein
MNSYSLLFIYFLAFFGKCLADEPEKVVGGVEPEEVLPYRQYVSEQNYVRIYFDQLKKDIF